MTSNTTWYLVDIITVGNRYGHTKKKPENVHEYNMYMSEINLADQLMYYLTQEDYTGMRKFFSTYLMMLILYKTQHTNYRFLSFRDSLIRSVI